MEFRRRTKEASYKKLKMTDSRQISLCIPNYNRVDFLLEAFEKVYYDQRISEIIVSDDHSDKEIYDQLEKLFIHFPKVKMFRNEINVDCHRNKKISIELAVNKWVIIFDSDNILYPDYLDRVFDQQWEEDIIITPSFASPLFDFRQYEGLLITKNNIAEWIDKPMFETMCNAANYFVNREEYLKVWDGGIDPVTSDSIFQFHNWLKAGNKVNILPNLTYFHRVHDGSHYRNNNHRTPTGFHEGILQKLRELR